MQANITETGHKAGLFFYTFPYLGIKYFAANKKITTFAKLFRWRKRYQIDNGPIAQLVSST